MKGQRRLLPVTVLAVLAALVVAAPAQAAVAVAVDPTAKRVKGGKALAATVSVTCDPGLETLEGHLTVSQDNQTITGTGSLGVLICDGAPHVVNVRVTAQEGRYHRGEAFASAFVLLVDASGNTQQGQDARTITVR